MCLIYMVLACVAIVVFWKVPVESQLLTTAMLGVIGFFDLRSAMPAGGHGRESGDKACGWDGGGIDEHLSATRARSFGLGAWECWSKITAGMRRLSC